MNRRQRIQALREEALPVMWTMNCSLDHIAACLGMNMKGVQAMAKTLRLGRRKPERKGNRS